MSRIWKDVCAGYQVSDDGFVRSLPDIGADGKFRTGRVLRAAPNRKGYMHVAIHGRTRYVHKMVAAAFVPGKAPGLQPNHKDGNKRNNRATNLEWLTGAKNMEHSFRVLGTKPAQQGKTGALCKNSKPVRGVRVSDGAVCEYAGASEAARELGIQQTGISAAARGAMGHYKGWVWEYI